MAVDVIEGPLVVAPEARDTIYGSTRMPIGESDRTDIKLTKEVAISAPPDTFTVAHL